MRLLIIGSLGGQIGAATKIAMEKGAKVAHANSVDQALVELRQGRGADLIMADVQLDIGLLVRSLANEIAPFSTLRATSLPRRYAGDLAVDGRGELLIVR